MKQKPSKPPGEPDSFNSEIQRPELRRRLINLARRKGILAADCEDVASEIIEEAIRCQAGYNPRCGSFSSWIMTIGRNVICSHDRKLNAQKRKPEGGMISYHAASAPDEHDALQLPDRSAEARRKSSEHAQHYIDTAGLSEKEKKAIAVDLDKEAEEIGSKPSSSTARRAIRKIQQAKSDEEFRESQQCPDALECAYGNIPAAERSAAVLYRPATPNEMVC